MVFCGSVDVVVVLLLWGEVVVDVVLKKTQPSHTFKPPTLPTTPLTALSTPQPPLQGVAGGSSSFGALQSAGDSKEPAPPDHSIRGCSAPAVCVCV